MNFSRQVQSENFENNLEEFYDLKLFWDYRWKWGHATGLNVMLWTYDSLKMYPKCLALSFYAWAYMRSQRSDCRWVSRNEVGNWAAFWNHLIIRHSSFMVIMMKVRSFVRVLVRMCMQSRLCIASDMCVMSQVLWFWICLQSEDIENCLLVMIRWLWCKLRHEQFMQYEELQPNNVMDLLCPNFLVPDLLSWSKNAFDVVPAYWKWFKVCWQSIMRVFWHKFSGCWQNYPMTHKL